MFATTFPILAVEADSLGTFLRAYNISVSNSLAIVLAFVAFVCFIPNMFALWMLIEKPAGILGLDVFSIGANIDTSTESDKLSWLVLPKRAMVVREALRGLALVAAIVLGAVLFEAYPPRHAIDSEWVMRCGYTQLSLIPVALALGLVGVVCRPLRRLLTTRISVPERA